MSGTPEPEPEPEPVTVAPPAPQTYAAASGALVRASPAPGPPAGVSLDAQSIAAAFAALAPTLLAPVNARLDGLQSENEVLRQEVLNLRAAATAGPPKPEPEPEVYYVPDYPNENPHPKRAPTDPLKPGLYDLRGDKTADALCAKAKKPGAEASKTAHWYEYQTLQCACSFLKCVLLHLSLILPRVITRVESTAAVDVEGVAVTGQDDADHLAAVYATVEEVYGGVLNKRVQLLQLRSMLTPEGGAVPDDKKGLLRVFENMLYGALGDTLPLNLDDSFKAALSTWEKQTQTQLIKTAAQSSAKRNPGSGTATPSRTTRPPKAIGKKKK